MEKVLENLHRFADKHGLTLQTKGEVGFGRPCVGLTDKRENNYLDFNPRESKGFDYIEELYDESLYGITPEDAYHKHDCFAVLVHNDDYEEALRQLSDWIAKLEQSGEVLIKEYETGATGMQALFSGTVGYAVKVIEHRSMPCPFEIIK